MRPQAGHGLAYSALKRRAAYKHAHSATRLAARRALASRARSAMMLAALFLYPPICRVALGAFACRRLDGEDVGGGGSDGDGGDGGGGGDGYEAYVREYSAHGMMLHDSECGCFTPVWRGRYALPTALASLVMLTIPKGALVLLRRGRKMPGSAASLGVLFLGYRPEVIRSAVRG